MKYKKNRIISLDNNIYMNNLNNKSNFDLKQNSKMYSLKSKIRNYNDLTNSNINNNKQNVLKINVNNKIMKDNIKLQNIYGSNISKDEPFDIQSNYVYSTIRKINSQNHKKLNKNLNSNNVYYNTNNNSPRHNQKVKDKNIPSLNFIKIKKLSDTSDCDTDNKLNKRYIRNKIINDVKNNNKIFPKNNLVISLNNIMNNENFSFSNLQLNNKASDEKNKTNYSIDRNNDFHNYLKMGSYFSNNHSRKKDKYDTVVNNGSQSERIRNSVPLEDKLRKIYPLNMRERVNNLRQNLTQSLNFGKLGPNNRYSNTQHNFYNHNNFEYDKDEYSNLDNNNDYFAHKLDKMSEISDDRINRRRIRHLIENNNNNNDYLYTKKIDNSSFQTFLITHTANTSINYDNSNNTTNNNEENNKISKSKPRQYIKINQKPNNGKIVVIKKNKNKKNINKNIENLTISSFELPLFSSLNGDKDEEGTICNSNSKIGFFLIKKNNGNYIYEIEINDKNMKIINNKLKEKNIELNPINEINELRQKNQKLKNQLKQMQDNILIYQKQNEDLIEENTKLKIEQKKK